MKRHTAPWLLAALACGSALADPVVEQRDWRERFDVGGSPTLTLDNVWGNITVTAGSSNRIEMSISSLRRANDQVSFDRSLEQIPLRIEQDGDTVSLRVGLEREDWWNMPRCNGCRLHVDLVVRVPANTTLDVRTVNDGDVAVSDVAGSVTATNVNGSVSTTGLAQCAVVETINGDVDVEFVTNPSSDCRIESLNGDIKLSLSPGTDVNLAVALVNGKMRSALDLAPHAIPATVERTTDGGRHRYEIEQLAGLRLGGGGHTLTLKSLNGDVLVAGSPKP